MTIERHLPERTRLNLERIRDALFETRVILAELERDNSVGGASWRQMEQELRLLEAQLQEARLEQAFQLRNRARDFYASPRVAAL
jgi:hypothetical protein